MDASVKSVGSQKWKFDKLKCAICGDTTVKLFCIPSNENMNKKWFAVLEWDVPPEKLKYVITNARICSKHFSDWCFTSTLKQRLIKFACPLIASVSQSSNAEVCVVESCSSKDICSSTSSHVAIPHQEITPKTRLIKVLRSKNSKLKKRLYKKSSSARFLGELKAKFADKPHLYHFILSQLKMQGRANKGRRWSPREKSFALQIYLQSPGTYKHLSQFFAFPSKSTVCRYTYNIAKTPGFCPNLIKCLKSQTSRMSESERLCVLTFDEMAIKQELTYAADIDCIDGVTTVKHDLKDEIPHATHALVFMAKGIEKNWKQILGYHFTSCSEKYSLTELIYEAIDIMESCKLEVIAIVCDQGPTNQSLFRQLKVTKDKPFFERNSKKIYTIYDPPHLLKSVRNNILNHGIYFEDKLAAEKPRTCKAEWKHIKDLYEKDSKKRFSACRKLTKRHIEVSGLKKMNVKLAAQVLSHSVAAALDLYVSANEIESKASETATFVYNMDKLFDSVNSKSLQHEKNEMCGLTQNSFHVEFWKEKIAWIEKWYIRSSKTKRLIRAACKNGWLITLKAFIEISEILLKKLKFILTSRFSQDALENTFSTIRQKGGFRDHPNANEFRNTIQKVIISNFLKRSQRKNCLDDDAYNLIDFTCFNKKELLEILATTDDTQDDNDKTLHDTDSLNLLDSIEENVLFYIAGYFAKKYLTFNECGDCKNLIVDENKILDNCKMFTYFKEYDINHTSGLKWPTKKFFQYFANLYNCFSSNFNLLFERNNVSKKLCDALVKCEVDFLIDHVEHKEKAQLFFVSCFVKLMVKHEIKKLSMKINNSNSVTNSRKKLKC